MSQNGPVDYKLFMEGQDRIQEMVRELKPGSGPDVNPLYFYTSVLIAFLQSHFMLVEGFEWSPDPKETKILITSQKLTEPPQKPALVVLRAGAQASGIVIDDRMDNSKLDQGTGREYTEEEQISGSAHGDIMSGHYAIGGLAKNGVEAEHLAWAAGGYIKKRAQELRSAGFHNIGVSVDIGPESEPGMYFNGDPPPDLISVTAVTPFYIPTLWHKLPIRQQKYGGTTVTVGAGDEEREVKMRGRLKPPTDKLGRRINGVWTPISS
jgi:hypothetical protein